MEITVASIAKQGKTAGFFGIIKGAIANLFIKPPKVTELGNTTMLEFGAALLQKKSLVHFSEGQEYQGN
jgi:hypothetical protein